MLANNKLSISSSLRNIDWDPIKWFFVLRLWLMLHFSLVSHWFVCASVVTPLSYYSPFYAIFFINILYAYGGTESGFTSCYLMIINPLFWYLEVGRNLLNLSLMGLYDHCKASHLLHNLDNSLAIGSVLFNRDMLFFLRVRNNKKIPNWPRWWSWALILVVPQLLVRIIWLCVGIELLVTQISLTFYDLKY